MKNGIKNPNVKALKINSFLFGLTGLSSLLALSIILIEGLTTAKLMDASSLFFEAIK